MLNNKKEKYYNELSGNLFSASDFVPLAHCIATDCALAGGIALQFRNKYPEMITYLENHKPYKVDDVIKYQAHNRDIYNLMDKKYSGILPQRKDLNVCLDKLFKDLKDDNQKEVIMPQIGQGIDMLNWNETKAELIRLSNKYRIKVTVYIYEQKESDNSRLINELYHYLTGNDLQKFREKTADNNIYLKKEIETKLIKYLAVFAMDNDYSKTSEILKVLSSLHENKNHFIKYTEDKINNNFKITTISDKFTNQLLYDFKGFKMNNFKMNDVEW